MSQPVYDYPDESIRDQCRELKDNEYWSEEYTSNRYIGVTFGCNGSAEECVRSTAYPTYCENGTRFTWGVRGQNHFLWDPVIPITIDHSNPAGTFHTFRRAYTSYNTGIRIRLCNDTRSVPFPQKDLNFKYSYETNKTSQRQAYQELVTFCKNHYGWMESSYKTCSSKYRCKWREGWTPRPPDNPDNPDNPPVWEPDCTIGCIGVKGTSSIKENFSYEYEVFYEHNCDTRDRAITVFLSYNAGTLKNGIDFTAPDRVTIPAGRSSTTIILNTHTYCDERTNLFIKIDPTSSETRNVCSSVKASLICEPPPEDFCERVGENCSNLFFFEPYGHRTKKANNM